MTKRERVVLVEGYDDRAFLAGYLTGIAGAVSVHEDPVGVVRTSDRSSRGQFWYRTTDDAFVRVIPVGGKDDKLRRALEIQVGRGKAGAFWVIRDADGPEAGPARASLESLRSRFDIAPDQFHPIVWFTEEPWAPVASSQTLESVIASALHDVDPARAESILAWLRQSPEPVDPGGKPVVWSHFGKWRWEDGPARYLQALWDDQAVASRLQRHLGTTEALAGLRALVGVDGT